MEKLIAYIESHGWRAWDVDGKLVVYDGTYHEIESTVKAVRFYLGY